MAWSEKDKQDMDNAANDAENDLLNYPDEHLTTAANWLKKWYMKAGYKRLGRILLECAKEEKKGAEENERN